MRDPVEFEIGDQTFRYTPLGGRAAIHIAAKIGPGFMDLLMSGALEKLTTAAQQAILDKADGVTVDDATQMKTAEEMMLKGVAFFGSMRTIAEFIAKMPAEDKDLLINTALTQIEWRRSNDQMWVKIFNADAKSFRFDQFDTMGNIVAFVWKMIEVDIIPFGAALA